MKKIVILMCAFCVLSTAANAADTTVQKRHEGIKNPPSKEEMAKIRKAREEAFEQKLGLTEAQKIKARELRQNAHKQMKPVIDELISKKKEARMVKMSRIAVQAQEEKLAVLDKEIQELEKKANGIRKKNMKEFESILTRDQRKILKQMKEEGRKRFEEHRGQRPMPCPEGGAPAEASK